MNDWVTNIKDFIENNKLGEVKLDCDFKSMSTLKVGGPIQVTYFPNSYDSFLIFHSYYKNNLNVPMFIIGNGSNLLASDELYKGIVVCFKKIKNELICQKTENGGIVTCNSGCLTKILYEFTRSYFLGGLEAIASIPATIGGIIAMNATCFGYESSKYLLKCLVLDNDKVYWLDVNDMKFSYRNSIFLKENIVILKAVFKFKTKTIEEIDKLNNEIIERRKNTQPIFARSAGSTFKNGENYSTWELIDKAGLRGYKIGGASVSTLHTNFLINENDAKAIDMYNLMKFVQEEVYNKFNIQLENEWVLVNF